jgi:hypothetical protein
MNGEWSDSRPVQFTSVEEQWYAMRRSFVGLGAGLSLCNKPVVTWKYYHSFSALSEKTVIYLSVTNIRGSIWERYIQSAMQVIRHLPKTWDPAEMFCRVLDVPSEYSFVFQSFWYFRTIFIKLFVPECLSELIYWIFWKGPRYWDKYEPTGRLVGSSWLLCRSVWYVLDVSTPHISGFCGRYWLSNWWLAGWVVWWRTGGLESCASDGVWVLLCAFCTVYNWNQGKEVD